MGPSKYYVFMVGEASAPTNAEENVKEEKLVENIQDFVKQQNDRISQIATQLQFLMERLRDPNDHSLVMPSSSNRRDPPASSQNNEARID